LHIQFAFGHGGDHSSYVASRISAIALAGKDNPYRQIQILLKT
jgi:hypothetical protein